MAFIPLPVFSLEYRTFVNMIDRSHKGTQDYAQLKHLIETSSLNSGEKSLLLSQLADKFAN